MIDYAPFNPRPRKPVMRDALLVVIASSGVAGLLYPFFPTNRNTKCQP